MGRRRKASRIERRVEARDISSAAEPDQPVLVAGAGAFLTDIIRLLKSCREFAIAGILDPSPDLRGQTINGVPVLGWLGAIPHGAVCVVIGTPACPGSFDREALFHLLTKRGMRLPILNASVNRLPAGTCLKRGTLLLQDVSIAEGAAIGENCLIGPGAHIGPGATVEDHAVVAPGDVVARFGNRQVQSTRPRSMESTLAAQMEPIHEIVRRLNMSGMEIILVADGEGALIGTVTDGDVRRGLLSGVNMTEPVATIMNRNPVTAPIGTPIGEMMRLMKSLSIRHLPIVDERGRPVRMEILESLYDRASRHDAVIMAGGLGMRLRPLTESVPKPLVPVAGKPILDHILTGLGNSGLKDVVISVNYLAHRIKEHVGNGRRYEMNVAYLTESRRLGTAGALSLLKPKPRAPFLVMNGDLLTDMDYSKLMAFFRRNRYAAAMCVRRYSQQVPYGVVEILDGTVKGLREKPVSTHFINAGIYVLRPSCISLIPEDTHFDMTDLMKEIIRTGGAVGAFPIVEYWRDIGTHDDLQAAAAERRGAATATA